MWNCFANCFKDKVGGDMSCIHMKFNQENLFAKINVSGEVNTSVPRL